MGNFCCKKDDALIATIYEPPANAPLLHSNNFITSSSYSSSSRDLENGGEYKENQTLTFQQQQEFKTRSSLSRDSLETYTISSAAPVICVPKKGADDNILEAVATELQINIFPLSLPSSITPSMFHLHQNPNSDEECKVQMRQRSTTHSSYFEPECIICLELFTKDNPRIKSKCRCKGITANPMHLGCLLSWTEQQQEQICPVCRDCIRFEGEDW
jgi:hypothetical protein